MIEFSWTHFLVLWLMGVFGIVAGMPYIFEVQKDILAEAPLPLPALIAASIAQGAVLTAILVGLGLLLVNNTGLNVTPLDNILAGYGFGALIDALPWAIVLGLLSKGAVVVIEIAFFHKHLPAKMRTMTQDIPVWKRFLAGFYGGITEELITRLFFMSLVVWLLGFVWQSPDGGVAIGVYWVAIFVAALVFGLLHLPVTRQMVDGLTPMLIIRAIVLNGIGGVVFGWIFWQHGLLAAMVSHFVGDMVLHIIAPMIVPKDETATVETMEVAPSA